MTQAVSGAEAPGRRARRRQRTRRALLDAALRLFAERGIASTRLEDLTERADLGKGAFYNYYESKDALVADLLAEAFAHLDRDYLHAVSEAHTLAERVVAIVRAHDAFFLDHPEYLVLFHHARGLVWPARVMHARLSQVFSDYLARLGALVLPPDRRHEWAGVDCRDLAAVLAGSISGSRSFEQAVGLAPGVSVLERMLAGGLPPLFEARRAAGAAAPPGQSGAAR